MQNRAVHFLLSIGFILTARPGPAQSIYTPYAITTIAGTAYYAGSADGSGKPAEFNQPAGVALDAAGNL